MSYFLDVQNSFTSRAWRARLDAAGEVRAQAIAQVAGQEDLVARVLAGRGISVNEVARFLDPTLRDLMPDPYSLAGMAAATERLVQAVERGELVGIFGDYDVDGAASAALLSEYLEAVGCPTLIHIPDRIVEGYGPNVEAMAGFKAKGVALVVTVDCGAVSHGPIAHAKSLRLDVVVLDHHQAPETLPEALSVVDPNRLDDLSGLGYLCAAGVVFMTLVALNRALREKGYFAHCKAPDLLAGLDLVALATVADVVPLVGLNRAFVARGLTIMKQRERPGLAALFDVAGADGPPCVYHLGFMIGPRINAGGRIGDAGLGARLLTTRDELLAQKIAAELDRLNRARQQIEFSMLAEAEAEAYISLGLEQRGAVVVVAGESWPPGVVGIVAARLKERFERPAFAFSLGVNEATGSARSIAGVDIGKVVRSAVDAGLAKKGGGHSMAAGLTISRESLGDLRAFLETTLAAPVRTARAGEALSIDAALTASGASAKLARSIEAAGPFGAGNPEPMFALARHRLTHVFPVGADHLRLRATAGDGAAIEAIAFRSAGKPLGQALIQSRGKLLHIAGALSINRYSGRQRAEMRVIDAATAE